MRWFRSNDGTVAWLAVFALACHSALTFGHVSVIFPSSANTSDWATAPSSRAQKTSTGRNQDFCAVCNQIGLAKRPARLLLGAHPPRPVAVCRAVRDPGCVKTLRLDVILAV